MIWLQIRDDLEANFIIYHTVGVFIIYDTVGVY